MVGVQVGTPGAEQRLPIMLTSAGIQQCIRCGWNSGKADQLRIPSLWKVLLISLQYHVYFQSLCPASLTRGRTIRQTVHCKSWHFIYSHYKTLLLQSWYHRQNYILPIPTETVKHSLEHAKLLTPIAIKVGAWVNILDTKSKCFSCTVTVIAAASCPIDSFYRSVIKNDISNEFGQFPLPS